MLCALKSVKSCLLIFVSVALIAISAIVSPPGFAAAPAALTAQEIKNAKFQIPALGADPVPFKHGVFKSESIPLAKLRATACGMLDGKPAAVVELVYCIGGNRNYETILLLRKVKGRVHVQGEYEADQELPAGGTMVWKIEIKNNKIYMYGEAPMKFKKIAQPLIRSSSVFKIRHGDE